MALNYITADERDFSGGIDARSSENQISPTFVKELLNADVIEKRVRKRVGYQGYAGNVPVRVTKIEYKTTPKQQVCFTLDTAVTLNATVVDLGAVSSSPLVVYGKLSSNATGTGPFGTVNALGKYYAKFEVLNKKEFTTTNTPIVIPSDEHGIQTTRMFSQVVELVPETQFLNRSYRTTIPNELIVDSSSYSLTVAYNNGTGSNFNVYVYYKDRSAVSGETFQQNYTKNSGDSTPISITAATHNLNSFNIIAQVQEIDGTNYKTIKPEEVKILANGTVEITVKNNTNLSVVYSVLLSAAPVANQVTGNINAGTTQSITLSDLESPWIFYAIYLDDGTNLVLVSPDTIQYDDAAKTATISFTNNTSSAQKFIVFYEYGNLRSNQLCVDDASVSVAGSDTRPEITLWGLDHLTIYGTTPPQRAGWVNHIDSYTSSGEQRLLCGLGGNLFASYSNTEKGSDYKYALLYPRLQARISAATVLAPTFWDNGETPGRTRGYITSSQSGTHWAKVTSVEYDTSGGPSNGWTKYTISLPNMQILNSAGAPTSVGSVIWTSANLNDYLTVQDMSYTKHNGTFKIRQVTAGTDELYIWVENANNSVDYNDGYTLGEAGIFTDSFVTTQSSPFVANDQVLNPALGDNVCYVRSTTGTTTVIDNVIDVIDIAAGIVTVGKRTSSVIPTRTSAPTYLASSENLVAGDMVAYNGTKDDRELRVISINSDTVDRSVTIVGDGETATVTLGSGDTSYLAVGRKILLYSAGVYSGVHTVTGLPELNKLTFASLETETVNNGLLVRHTVEVDEELTWQDSVDDSQGFFVPRRWLPVEAPADQIDKTPNTYIRYFDSYGYGNQPFIRSTAVMNNLYLTNYDDEVMKYDGENIYRAGLFPWQPGLFLTQTTALTNKIVTNLKFITAVAAGSTTEFAANLAAGKFEIQEADINSIPIGSLVKIQGDTIPYTVKDYNATSGGKHFIIFDRSIDASKVTETEAKISQIFTRRYYFRLDAVDANDNIIASAMTGSQDHVIQLNEDAAVLIKLVGLPVWDVYDYDRLYVNIYATRNNTAGPFYKLDTVPINFTNTRGYITYVDALSDENLITNDAVSTLTGGEIGVGWQEPIRSKYITSIANRLIQANIKDYPLLDIQIEEASLATNDTYHTKKFTFRRSNAGSGTVTDMVDTAVYEFIKTPSGNVTSLTKTLGTSFTVKLSGSLAGVAAKDWIYLTYSALNNQSNKHTFTPADVKSTPGTGAYFNIAGHGYTSGQQVVFSTTETLPGGLSLNTTYYVLYINQNEFRVSATLGGTAVNMTSAGTGTHTVQLQGNDLTYSGWWQIASVDSGAGTVTINYTGPVGLGHSVPDKYVFATDPTDIPVLLGLDGNMGMVNGESPTSDTFDVGRRLSMAINSSMRMVDLGLTPSFVPWLTARGGNDVGQIGRIVVKQPRSESLTPEVVLPSSFSYTDGTGETTSFTIFVNNIRRSVDEQVSATTRVYPSRLTVSYENYPEIVDSPFSIRDIDSFSAIDVNSADGQEITGVIPFFGETAFTASQQESMLVVFKTNSIYLVDVIKKAAGQPCLQKIETEGLGCTAPYSIARTKKGIIFANESGIYCLRRDQSIQYLGRYMERKWLDNVDRDALNLCQGHHYAIGRAYKLSVPLVGQTACSQVFVYNHTGEDYGNNQLGAWAEYDSHPATGWANLGADAFFSATHGRVYSIRRQGTETDFRDDNKPISFSVDTRALDFGNSGIRKVLDSILIDYRVPVESTGTQVLYAADTQQEFRESTPFTIQKSSQNTGFDDNINRDIQTIRHDTDRRRGNYFQVRITNYSIDEGLEIAGISFRVGGMTDKGTKQARQTRNNR